MDLTILNRCLIAILMSVSASLTAETLVLRDGTLLQCDSYHRENGQVMIVDGDKRYSLAERFVNWEVTEAYVEPPTEPESAESAGEPLRPGHYEDLVPKEEAVDQGPMITKIDFRDASLIEVLRFMADKGDVNLVVDPAVRDRKVNYFFKNISWRQAWETILWSEGLDYEALGGAVWVRR
ncbi:hypothetical protein SCOR_12840 [Sulfidibacter corallicola]